MPHPDLEHLYDAHAAGLFHYLLGFTKSEPDAKDLLQEIFVKVASRGGTEALRDPKAFLFRMAHNLAIDWTRRRRSRTNADRLLAAERSHGHQIAGDPDQEILATGFAAALATLPDEQRSVVELRLWEGLSFEAIAEAQAIPMNTAASRYRYGIDKLRGLLRPLFEELQ